MYSIDIPSVMTYNNSMDSPCALIIGGTTGLGLALAKLLQKNGMNVIVTGRSKKEVPSSIQFISLDITESFSDVVKDVDTIVNKLPSIDLVVFCAAFYEQGHLDELGDAHIEATLHISLTAPALFLNRMLQKQGGLSGVIAITSTSQWTPREKEPIYSASKAGLAMLMNSASLDPRIKKVLVAGPAGMQTPFWEGTGKDQTSLLSPEWVGEQILALWNGVFRFRLVRILRSPSRVEVLESR